MERRSLADDIRAVVSATLEERGFLAAFTERTGGVSDGAFESLNLGILTEDRRDNVLENRGRTIEALRVPKWAMAWQRHGAELAAVSRDRAGAGFDDGAPIEGVDALVTDEAQVSMAVLVADCLPVAMADPDGGRLAVVHAGWRGIAAGVLERAVAAFDRRPLVAIGPAIGPCHYEVGPEVVEAIGPDRAVTERRDGRLYLDLPRTAAGILSATSADAEVAGVCTYCDRERFFSHRRDGPTGRQALVAMRLS